jgi:hypothetical protein
MVGVFTFEIGQFEVAPVMQSWSFGSGAGRQSPTPYTANQYASDDKHRCSSASVARQRGENVFFERCQILAL